MNALLAGVVFTPSANYDGSFAIAVSVNDGVAAPITGIKIVTGTPVGDTPQVGSITTPASVQSDLIVIDRNADDGAEVTHFRIANITNGTLYLADGITPIHDGDYITVAQGQAGVRFTPVADTLDNGSFTVEVLRRRRFRGAAKRCGHLRDHRDTAPNVTDGHHPFG